MYNSLLCISIDGNGDEVRTAKDVRLLISKYVEEIAVRAEERAGEQPPKVAEDSQVAVSSLLAYFKPYCVSNSTFNIPFRHLVFSFY